MSLGRSSPPDEVCRTLREAIEKELPESKVAVTAGSPGHFEIGVVSAAFAGKSVVQQQQMVYRAIAALMKGDDAPVHAIDRLRTEVR